MRADELAWVNARYAEIDFLASDSADLVAIAEVDGVVAGLGRIVPIQASIGELGGMYVLQNYRGLGLAKRIVQFLLQATDCQVLYCLPFAELAGFYEGMGFSRCDESCDGDSAVPEKIAAKFRWCNAHYSKPVLLLKKAAT